MQVRERSSTCQISKIQKIVSGDEITTKWQNIRDAFVRSLKKKSGQAMQRKYVYHDQLQFLFKVVNKDETISSISDTEIGDVEQEFEIPISPENTPTTSEGSSQLSLVSKKQSNRKRMAERMADPIESEILKRLKESSVPVDEDESFFNSMVPTVRKMSDDEKLEFRMGVLQLIQKIKLKRQISSPSYLDSSNSSSVSQFPAVAAPQYNLDANQQARTYESFYPQESYTVSNNRSPEDSQNLELL